MRIKGETPRAQQSLARGSRGVAMTSWITVSVGFRRPHESKTKPGRFETTSEGGFRSLRFRSADSPASCGRKAEPYKTFAVSP